MCKALAEGEQARLLRMFGFFFQAEDGIRDKLVTGVQTCALPISGASVTPLLTNASGNALVLIYALGDGRQYLTQTFDSSPYLMRSEERRVGKECRSRRAQEHEKKKKSIKTQMSHGTTS